MKITYNVKNGTCTIFLSGELDECTSGYSRNELDNILQSLPIGTNIIYDFSQLQFMDSTGIGVLLGRYKKYLDKGLKYSIKNPTRSIDRILKMTGIYSIISVAV